MSMTFKHNLDSKNGRNCRGKLKNTSKRVQEILHGEKSRKNVPSKSQLVATPIEAELKISAPDDKCEQEADQVSDMVIRMPDPESVGQTHAIRSDVNSNIQCRRNSMPQGKLVSNTSNSIQRKESSDSASTLTTNTLSHITGLSGRGQILSQEDRDYFEPRFGQEFGDVRIHKDKEAGKSALELNAKAYTIGNNIVFGDNQYQPKNNVSRKLLAHELTHVVQQRFNDTNNLNIQRDVLRPRRWNLANEERRQRWSAQELGQLGDYDQNYQSAIIENRLLGFIRNNLKKLRVILGLPERPPRIDRRFVEAVQRAQSGLPIIVVNNLGLAANGSRPNGDSTKNGILDLETILKLQFQTTNTTAFIRQYQNYYNRRNSIWRMFREDIEKFNTIKSMLNTRLQLDASDINIIEGNNRRRISVSNNFLNRVALWQLWIFRRQREINYGKLGVVELAELGFDHNWTRSQRARIDRFRRVSSTVETALPLHEETGGDIDDTNNLQGDSRVEEQQQPEILTRAQVLALIDSEVIPLLRSRDNNFSGLLSILPDNLSPDILDNAIVCRLVNAIPRQIFFRPSDEARREEIKQRFDTIRQFFERLNLPRTNFNRSRRSTRFNAIAGALRAELRYICDENERPRWIGNQDSTTGESNIAESEAPALVRTGHDRALQELRDSGTVIAEGASAERSAENWESRVIYGRTISGGVSHDVVRDIAQSNIEWLDSVASYIRRQLHIVNNSPVVYEGVIADILTYISEHKPSDQLSKDWNPPSRPRRPNNRNMERWIRALTNSVENEKTRYQGYLSFDTENTNVDRPIMADFNITGVSVVNNRGYPLPPSAMRLNVQFAHAFLGFLRTLQRLGVTEIWTAGFWRSPKSPNSAHTQGRACDITGFVIGSEFLHLRSGRPQRRPDPSDTDYRQKLNRYMDMRRGHSDWFDRDDAPIRGHTHEQIMHGITNIMRTYFSLIVGPGHNRGHLGHWHVELTNRLGDIPVRALHLDESHRDSDITRWDSLAPGWQTLAENERRGEVSPTPDVVEEENE